MDIPDLIRSIRAFDLLVLLTIAIFFILGFIQGAIRRVLGILSMLFAFLVAAQLRAPVGGYLAENWTQFAPEYSMMLGFLLSFAVLAIGSTIVIEVFYKRVVLFEDREAADEVVGGILGVVQGIIFIGILIVILDTFFRIPGIAIRSSELPLLRELHGALDPSATAAIYRATLIPAFFALTGLFIPDEVKAFFGG